MNKQELNYSFDDIDTTDEKLGEMIVYVATKCGDDPNFGATKLNKILYFADMISYLNYGEPITGTEYMRLGQGPVPKRLLPVRDVYQKNGDIGLAVKSYYGKEQHRVIAQRLANLDIFKPRDIAIVDEVIADLWDKNASDVSELSHGIAWRIAKEKESIPYQAAYLSDEGITKEDIERAQELISEYGWDV